MVIRNKKFSKWLDALISQGEKAGVIHGMARLILGSKQTPIIDKEMLPGQTPDSLDILKIIESIRPQSRYMINRN